MKGEAEMGVGRGQGERGSGEGEGYDGVGGVGGGERFNVVPQRPSC